MWTCGKDKPAHKNLSYQFFSQVGGKNSRPIGDGPIKIKYCLYGQNELYFSMDWMFQKFYNLKKSHVF